MHMTKIYCDWIFLIGGRKKLPLILVEFLTVNMVNAQTENGAVQENSLFTKWYNLSQQHLTFNSILQ